MINMNQESSAEGPDLFDKIIQKELDNFGLFERVSAAAMVRRTNYVPGISGKRYPSKITVYGAIPVANEYVQENEEPASGLVLSKRETVPRGHMYDGLLYGEEYFNGKTDCVVVPTLTIISSMLPEAKAVDRISRPAIHIVTGLDGTQERTILDPTFVLDPLEAEFQQSRFADYLGVMALRLLPLSELDADQV